jgi:5-methylcytosine-specific restriction endonuclease McrA
LKSRRENPEKYRERGRESYKKHPERYKENCRKRRIRKLNGGGFHACKEFQLLKSRTGNICLCCKIQESKLKDIYKNKKYWRLTEDHIIPLTKGGSDNINNIQPLCFHCNSVKNNKIISLEELRKIL